MTVPEHKDYGIWRAAIDEAVDIAEGIVANRVPTTSTSPALPSGRRSRSGDLESARGVARRRQADLEGRDAGAPGRAGRNRKDGYAHILEDPEAHRKRLEEAMKRDTRPARSRARVSAWECDGRRSQPGCGLQKIKCLAPDRQLQSTEKPVMGWSRASNILPVTGRTGASYRRIARRSG